MFKTLKEQAGIQDNPDQEGLDLFAELIIRECARVADIEKEPGIGCGYITKSTGDTIIEHFGLE